MKNTVLLSVFLVFLDGVFSQAAEGNKVSGLEGDSVTFHTSVTETSNIDLMMWMYGSQGSIIAKLNGKSQQISLYDVDDGRFGDRLQLDNQTGSLSISDIRTKHSGDYQLKIISYKTLYMTFNLIVHDVFFAGLTNSKEGETVTLQTGVSELQKYDVILWMFGPLSPDTFMAEINIPLQKISYSDDERLRDRLQLNEQTGSLTIMDSRSTDTGVYQLQFTNSKETSYKRYNVFVSFMCNMCSQASTGVFSQAAEGNKVSVLEGGSVTFHTSVTETHNIDLMMWMYGSQGSIIAKLNGKSQQISLYDVDDGRFGDRLQLDNQTGSLSISDIRTKHSGDYQLKIISYKTSYMTFNLTVHDVFFAGLTNSKEGETVTLQTGVSELQKYDVILWMFGPLSPDTFMAEINIPLQKISYSDDERLRDRLQLNDQTGSLTIVDSRSTDTGVYQLQITNSKETSYKRYNVFVTVPEPDLPLVAVVLICIALLAAAAVATVITVCYKNSIPKCKYHTIKSAILYL
ncbi:uncharacterized protein [Garra rufa]|uniref:uncharacterized protein n=1 Tax=Garra rufa TaxID=137080 RepID=UPI003CCE8C8C